MEKEMIYDLMNGFLDLSIVKVDMDMSIADEFEEGTECESIYEKVSLSKRRLEERLGVNEDRDIEKIVWGMEEIMRILCLKMYEYGEQAAKKRIRVGQDESGTI